MSGLDKSAKGTSLYPGNGVNNHFYNKCQVKPKISRTGTQLAKAKDNRKVGP